MTSHQPRRSTLRTSHWMCCPGLVVGRKSHDHASWPRAASVSRTVPENSQATRMRSLLAKEHHLYFFCGKLLTLILPEHVEEAMQVG